MPSLIRNRQLRVDAVFSMASPMNEHGFFALSLATDYTMAAVSMARAVILEVNPNVPFTNGNCHVHISQVAGLVESEEPILEVSLPKIGAVQQDIGEYVTDIIDDGSTLQIGFGAIPDAVVMQLTHKHDLVIPGRLAMPDLGSAEAAAGERGFVRKNLSLPGFVAETGVPMAPLVVLEEYETTTSAQDIQRDFFKRRWPELYPQDRTIAGKGWTALAASALLALISLWVWRKRRNGGTKQGVV